MILDIVFQSGDFINPNSSWPIDLLINIVGAAVGAGATMLALILTFKNDRAKDEKRRLQLQHEKIKYLRSLVVNSIKEIQQQIAGLKAFAEDIEENPITLPLLPQSAQNDILRLVHRINQEDYFHAYLGQFSDTDEMVEEFRKIYGFLDFFDGIIKLIHEALRKSVDFDHNRKLALRKLIEDTQDEVAGLLVNPRFAEQNEMLDLVNSILIDYHDNKTNKSDISYGHEQFVVPLKKELVKYRTLIPEVIGILVDLRKATYIFTDIQMQNQFVAKDFETDHASLVEHLETFERLTERLRSYKG
jgi:hypothetical protein